MTENASKILDNEQKINEAHVRLESAEERLRKEQDLLNRLSGNPEAYDFQAGIVRTMQSNVDKIYDEDAVGKSVTDASDFFSLTSEEMWKAATGATTEYAKLKELADDGYKDAAQYMDDYIGYWQELEELENEYNEKLTSVSFDTIQSDFLNRKPAVRQRPDERRGREINNKRNSGKDFPFLRHRQASILCTCRHKG